MSKLLSDSKMHFQNCSIWIFVFQKYFLCHTFDALTFASMVPLLPSLCFTHIWSRFCSPYFKMFWAVCVMFLSLWTRPLALVWVCSDIKVIAFPGCHVIGVGVMWHQIFQRQSCVVRQWEEPVKVHRQGEESMSCVVFKQQDYPQHQCGDVCVGSHHPGHVPRLHFWTKGTFLRD